ncbi:MAG: DUF2911 domain-containing protein [Vicingaceae bacterium]|nr:DUF2911 domain-containing protein [Vicingaceae bacterium]
MKKTKFIALAIVASFAFNANAQIESPQPSPLGEVEQKIGLTDIEIEYSRPGKKGREIFGKLVPYGKIWRTGANASTKIEVSDDIKINGKELKEGKYALYAIPGETEWTIIFHNNLKHWGVGEYKEEEDALRITAKPTKSGTTVETLTFQFGNFTSTGGKLMLMWDNTIVAMDIETNAMEKVEAQINKTLVEGPSASSYAKGAEFYMENGKDLEQALAWMDKAIEKRADAFWYIHGKAKILAKLGKKKEAIAAANKSIEVAKASKNGDYGYVAKNEEFIKSLK